MSQSDIEVILYRLNELDKKFDELREDQKAMNSKGACPAPGSCLLIKRDVDDLLKKEENREARVRHLESVMDEAKGMGKMGKILWGFVGAGGVSAAYTMLHAANLIK